MTFEFGSPWFLLLLLLIPLIVGLRRLPNRWSQQRRGVAGLRYADVSMVATGDRSWRVRLRPLLPILRTLTLILLIVALARPRNRDAREIITGEGVDIGLALDISGSMGTLDFQPSNRLEAAKQVITDFISQRPYDRIGLIVFANRAFVQSPLTVDHDVLSRQLVSLDLAPVLGLEDGTAIGLGVANAANLVKDSAAESRVVILLTDGVNNAGEINPLTAAEAARELGIKVYTIGVGSPVEGAALQRGLFGPEIVNSETLLDEVVLREIADLTGGQYYRAVDTDSLNQIYTEISALERSDVEIEIFNRYDELMVWALMPALGLFLLEMVLKHTFLRSIP